MEYLLYLFKKNLQYLLNCCSADKEISSRSTVILYNNIAYAYCTVGVFVFTTSFLRQRGEAELADRLFSANVANVPPPPRIGKLSGVHVVKLGHFRSDDLLTRYLSLYLSY